MFVEEYVYVEVYDKILKKSTFALRYILSLPHMGLRWYHDKPDSSDLLHLTSSTLGGWVFGGNVHAYSIENKRQIVKHGKETLRILDLVLSVKQSTEDKVLFASIRLGFISDASQRKWDKEIKYHVFLTKFLSLPDSSDISLQQKDINLEDVFIKEMVLRSSHEFIALYKSHYDNYSQYFSVMSNLSLVNVRLNDDHMKTISIITTHTAWSLKQLDLSQNNISYVGIYYLSKALIKCKKLSTINLSSNIIGDKGAVAIAKAITHNLSTIISLNLANNLLTADSIRPLSLFIAKHTSKLAFLDISHNKIGDAVIPFVSLFTYMTPSNLQHCNISHCGVSQNGIKELEKFTIHCKSLQHIDVRGNRATVNVNTFLATKVGFEVHCDSIYQHFTTSNETGPKVYLPTIEGSKLKKTSLKNFMNLRRKHLDNRDEFLMNLSIEISPTLLGEVQDLLVHLADVIDIPYKDIFTISTSLPEVILSLYSDSNCSKQREIFSTTFRSKEFMKRHVIIKKMLNSTRVNSDSNEVTTTTLINLIQENKWKLNLYNLNSIELNFVSDNLLSSKYTKNGVRYDFMEQSDKVKQNQNKTRIVSPLYVISATSKYTLDTYEIINYTEPRYFKAVTAPISSNQSFTYFSNASKNFITAIRLLRVDKKIDSATAKKWESLFGNTRYKKRLDNLYDNDGPYKIFFDFFDDRATLLNAMFNRDDELMMKTIQSMEMSQVSDCLLIRTAKRLLYYISDLKINFKACHLAISSLESIRENDLLHLLTSTSLSCAILGYNPPEILEILQKKQDIVSKLVRNVTILNDLNIHNLDHFLVKLTNSTVITNAMIARDEFTVLSSNSLPSSSNSLLASCLFNLQQKYSLLHNSAENSVYSKSILEMNSSLVKIVYHNMCDEFSERIANELHTLCDNPKVLISKILTCLRQSNRFAYQKTLDESNELGVNPKLLDLTTAHAILKSYQHLSSIDESKNSIYIVLMSKILNEDYNIKGDLLVTAARKMYRAKNNGFPISSAIDLCDELFKKIDTKSSFIGHEDYIEKELKHGNVEMLENILFGRGEKALVLKFYDYDKFIDWLQFLSSGDSIRKEGLLFAVESNENDMGIERHVIVEEKRLKYYKLDVEHNVFLGEISLKNEEIRMEINVAQKMNGNIFFIQFYKNYDTFFDDTELLNTSYDLLNKSRLNRLQFTFEVNSVEISANKSQHVYNQLFNLVSKSHSSTIVFDILNSPLAKYYELRFSSKDIFSNSRLKEILQVAMRTKVDSKRLYLANACNYLLRSDLEQKYLKCLWGIYSKNALIFQNYFQKIQVIRYNDITMPLMIVEYLGSLCDQSTLALNCDMKLIVVDYLANYNNLFENNFLCQKINALRLLSSLICGYENLNDVDSKNELRAFWFNDFVQKVSNKYISNTKNINSAILSRPKFFSLRQNNMLLLKTENLVVKSFIENFSLYLKNSLKTFYEKKYFQFQLVVLSIIDKKNPKKIIKSRPQDIKECILDIIDICNDGNKIDGIYCNFCIDLLSVSTISLDKLLLGWKAFYIIINLFKNTSKYVMALVLQMLEVYNSILVESVQNNDSNDHADEIFSSISNISNTCLNILNNYKYGNVMLSKISKSYSLEDNMLKNVVDELIDDKVVDLKLKTYSLKFKCSVTFDIFSSPKNLLKLFAIYMTDIFRKKEIKRGKELSEKVKDKLVGKYMSLLKCFALYENNKSTLMSSIHEISIQPNESELIDWNKDIFWDHITDIDKSDTCRKFLLKRRLDIINDFNTNFHEVFGDEMNDTNYWDLAGMRLRWLKWLKLEKDTPLPYDCIFIDILFSEECRNVICSRYGGDSNMKMYLLAIQLFISYFQAPIESNAEKRGMLTPSDDILQANISEIIQINGNSNETSIDDFNFSTLKLYFQQLVFFCIDNNIETDNKRIYYLLKRTFISYLLNFPLYGMHYFEVKVLEGKSNNSSTEALLALSSKSFRLLDYNRRLLYDCPLCNLREIKSLPDDSSCHIRFCDIMLDKKFLLNTQTSDDIFLIRRYIKSCCVDILSKQILRDSGSVFTFNHPFGNVKNSDHSLNTLEIFRDHTIKYCILPSPPFPCQIAVSKNHFIVNDTQYSNHGLGLETTTSLSMTECRSINNNKTDDIDAITERHWFSQIKNDLQNSSFYGDDLRTQLIRFSTNGTSKNFTHYNIITESKGILDRKYCISDDSNDGNFYSGKKSEISMTKKKLIKKIKRQFRHVDWEDNLM